MKEIVTNKNAGEILKLIRNENNLSIRKFANKFNKSSYWEHSKENNKHKIYINDLKNIIKLYNYDIHFKSEILGITLKLSEQNPNDLLRYIREANDLNQSSFANTIGKSVDWEYSNEVGRSNYFANDLFKLASKNNFIIILESKERKLVKN